ncbi:MAG: T9SS type A sorting domain-containing protein [Phaeodactylibacter sp.]|nr:T9SS type A sorting domain-containing protein [Phaeodactylibacter sp.]
MKKSCILAAALWVACPFLLFGQNTFTKNYGLPPTYEGLEDIVEANGRYYGLGAKYAGGAENLDLYLAVLGPEGELLQEFTYGTGDNRAEEGRRIIPLPDGLLLLGQVRDYHTFQGDLLALKVGFDGQLEWTKFFGSPSFIESFGDAAQNEAGDILLFGARATLPSNPYFLKINAEGDVLLEIAGPSPLTGDNLVAIPNSNGGWYVAFAEAGNQQILKLDDNLQEEWRATSADLPLSVLSGIFYALIELGNGDLLSVSRFPGGILVVRQAADGSFLQESVIEDDALGGFGLFPSHAGLLANGNVLIGFRHTQDYASGSLLLEINTDGEEQRRLPLEENLGQLNRILPLGSGALLAGATLEVQGGVDAQAAALSGALEFQWVTTAGQAGRYGEEAGYGVIEGEDGSFYILGVETLWPGRTDITLTQVNANGNVLWQSYFGTEGRDIAYSLARTADGNIAIFGYRTSGDNTAGIVIYKVSTDGNLIWETSFDPQAPIQVFKGGIVGLPDGSVVAGCHTFANEALLIRLSGDGAIEWVHQEVPQIPLLEDQVVSFRCFEITLSNDGDILLAGGAFLSQARYGALTQKHSASDGSPIWASFLARENLVRPYSLTTLDDGSAYGLGWEIINQEFSRILYKLDSDGDSIWFRSEPVDMIDYPANYSLSPAPGQQLLAVGAVATTQAENFIEGQQIKGLASLLDDDGQEIWRREFSPVYYTLLYDGIATSDGGFALVGLINNAQPGDIYFVKMAGDGAVSAEAPVRPELKLRLFPNPADEVLQAELRGIPQGKVQAMLYNARGQLLRSWNYEKASETMLENIDVSQLPAGSYFLSIAVDGVRYGRQWVKR